MKGLIVECVQDCIADTLTYNYQMRGILTTGMTCVGRILKTGIWVLQHQLIGHPPDRKSAQQGQARYPTWARCLPIFCSFDYPYIYIKVMKTNVTTGGNRQA